MKIWFLIIRPQTMEKEKKPAKAFSALFLGKKTHPNEENGTCFY